MNDKELLKYAAIACQWAFEDDDDDGLSWVVWGDDNVPMFRWNPLTDDGDALRLAVKCGLSVQIGASVFVYDHPDFCDPAYTGVETCESLKTDPMAATRRAIVRAAAEIGKEMK
jgi:hypothetical protein